MSIVLVYHYHRFCIYIPLAMHAPTSMDKASVISYNVYIYIQLCHVVGGQVDNDDYTQ